VDLAGLSFKACNLAMSPFFMARFFARSLSIRLTGRRGSCLPVGLATAGRTTSSFTVAGMTGTGFLSAIRAEFRVGSIRRCEGAMVVISSNNERLAKRCSSNEQSKHVT
jgi:cytochrome c biogenesis protein CcdA